MQKKVNNQKKTSENKTELKKVRRAKKVVTPENEIHSKMSKLETAYLDAISGKIKFGEVKNLFKKFHKEIKGVKKC